MQSQAKMWTSIWYLPNNCFPSGDTYLVLPYLWIFPSSRRTFLIFLLMRHILSLHLVLQKMVNQLTGLCMLNWVNYGLAFLSALFLATLPPHVLMQCKESLHMKDDNTVSIRLSTNQCNLINPVIPMVGNISNFNNLNFLVPESYYLPMDPLNKTLVFIDSKVYSGKLCNHLLSRFPCKQWALRPV